MLNMTGNAANGKTAVAATTTVVLTANSDRKGVIICNDSDEVIYLAFGAAVMNQGIGRFGWGPGRPRGRVAPRFCARRTQEWGWRSRAGFCGPRQLPNRAVLMARSALADKYLVVFTQHLGAHIFHTADVERCWASTSKERGKCTRSSQNHEK